MENDQKKIFSFAQSEKLMPQEEMLEIRKSKKNITIGIPKEIAYQENRIALVPNGVFQLTQNGHEVIIESDAGKAAHFLDNEYSEAGGRIVYDSEEIFKSNIIFIC